MRRILSAAALAAALLAGGIMDPVAADPATDTQTRAVPGVTPDLGERFARLALDCVHREYPNNILHLMTTDADAAPPRVLHPAFYGCFDWHSSVHGHWLLVRLARLFPDAPFAAQARAKLDRSFTPENIAGEINYFDATGRGGYERPYGLAWFLQLTAELREWDDPDAKRWLETLTPLETLIADNIRVWVPKLVYPIRVGTHNQSAFAFTLILDWARTAKDSQMDALITDAAFDFHAGDVNCPITYEPSGEDFLSPCLMTADLMRRVMSQDAFAKWLTGFLPDLPTDGSGDWLAIARVSDRSDGKLVHLDGVNLSRAWTLDGIAHGLPESDARRGALLAAARIHEEAGIASVSDEHYAGSHWLASFATYLVTRRGIGETP